LRSVPAEGVLPPLDRDVQILAQIFYDIQTGVYKILKNHAAAL